MSYCDLKVPSRAGQGARILGALAEGGVNLVAFSGFPERGKAQIDLVTDDLAGLRKVARREGWRLSRLKRCFVIQGEDRVGGVHHHVKRLAEAGINITAVDAVAAGNRRFGMILWVKPRDYARAAEALRAR
jgi:predicted amino acid-binding ACT domain protein